MNIDRTTFIAPTRLSTENLSLLRLPFDPSELQWKVQAQKRGADFATVVVYVDARTVTDRLNDVMGADWELTYHPQIIELPGVYDFKTKGEVTERGVLTRLTVGGVTREGIGTPSSADPLKGAYSDGLKRAAVGFGMGSHLYRFPRVQAKMNGNFLDNAAVDDLRALVEMIYQNAPRIGYKQFPNIKVMGYSGGIFTVSQCEYPGCSRPVESPNSDPETAAFNSRKMFGKCLCRQCARDQMAKSTPAVKPVVTAA